MGRTTAAVLLLGSLAGCISVDTGPETGGMKPNWGRSYPPPSVPGVAGPYGAKVPMAAPYSYNPPGSQYAAQQMMGQSIPMNMVQFNQGGVPGALPGMPMPPGGLLSPPGVPFAPGGPGSGPVNPTGWQGPSQGGVVPANIPPGMMPGGGIVQAQYSQAAGVRFPAPRTQVKFKRPANMQVSWFTVGPDGKAGYSDTPLFTPANYNFAQGAIYRLKISNIEGRLVPLYPTMEVVPSNPKTDAFLAHNAVPVEFTPEDLKQVAEGNYIVKVIYLPDPNYQDAAGNGIDEIVSTRLEPTQDPVQEALKRGSILLIIRMGNVDQEAPNTPPLVTPGPAAAMPAMPQLGGPGTHGPTMPMLQVPMYGMPNGTMPHSGPPALPIAPPGALPLMPGAAPSKLDPKQLPPLPAGPIGAPAPAVPPAGTIAVPGPIGPAPVPGASPVVPSPLFGPPQVPPATEGKTSAAPKAPTNPATLPVSSPQPVTSLPDRLPPAAGPEPVVPSPAAVLPPPPALPPLPTMPALPK